MTGRLRFLARYLAFWVVLLALARVLFLAWHWRESVQLGVGTLAAVLANGLRMDLSAAAYLTAVAALIVTLEIVAPRRVVASALHVVTIAAIALVALIVTVDLELYASWRYRLDATLLPYLRTPREALASAAAAPIAALAIVLVLFAAVGIVAYRRLVAPRLARLPELAPVWGPALLVCSAVLVVPIRGGLQEMPLNPGTVYFSRVEFANQAALDVAWNFFHSVTTHDYRTRNPYTELVTEADARAIVDTLLRTDDARTRRLLRVERPNVILIIWESLTAKVVGRLGAERDATPSLDSLAHEGVLFDRIYASGDRSAKGLAAILSGFPSQPYVQIMNSPSKQARLPALSHDLRATGYETAFYYGGDLDFADFRAYFLAHDFHRIVSKSAFARSDWGSRWGAHDHVVLGRVLRDVGTMRRPFFTTVFTLSSHEPYTVPMAPRSPGTDETTRFLDAHAYTDRSVADFLAAAKRAPWWDSTLVIIIADHGHVLPRHERDFEPALDYHIPMLWLGGALAVRDTVVSTVGSQVDLAPTVLAQLGLPHADYRWGKNLLAPNVVPFAFFAYLDGFGWVTPRGDVTWDNLARRVTEQRGDIDAGDVRRGQAYQRLSYQDYLDR